MNRFNLISILMVLALIFSVGSPATAANGGQVIPDENDIYSISYTLGLQDSGRQYTLLVVRKGADLEALQAEDILYIDQVESTREAASFEGFQLRGNAEVDADVYIGGETMDQPFTQYFIQQSPCPETALAIPAESAQVFVPEQYQEPVTVKNQNGDGFVLPANSKYGVAMGTVLNYTGWTLTEWGVELFSEDGRFLQTCRANEEILLTAAGRFGMMLYGAGLSENTYQVRVYAKYKEKANPDHIVPCHGAMMQMVFPQ